MILALNYQYLNRHKRRAFDLPHGPPSEAQTEAIIGLGHAADLLYQTSPEEVRTHDWMAELKGKKISYEGDEIACPERLTGQRGAPAPRELFEAGGRFDSPLNGIKDLG